MERLLGLVAVRLVALAGAITLAGTLDRWHAHSLDEQGRALVAKGRYLPAVPVLPQAVAEAPGDARARHYLGLARAGIRVGGTAWIHLEEAARLAPTCRRSREALGPACRDDAARSQGPGHFDHTVHRDRQGGAHS